MRLWAKIYKDDRIIKDAIFPFTTKLTQESFENRLMEICHDMDLSTPVSLKCHFRDVSKLNSVKYIPRDFIDDEDIDYFLIELCPDEKDKSKKRF